MKKKLATLSDFEYQINSYSELILTKYIGTKPRVEIPSYFEVEENGCKLFVNTLDKRCFVNNKNIKEVILNEGIKKIEESCFYNSSVVKVNIPDSVTTIGDSCFGSSKIESLDLTNVMYVGNEVCQYCRNLKKLKLSQYQVFLDDKWMTGCTDLEELFLPNSLKVISSSNFLGITKLKKLEIGNKCQFQLDDDGITLYDKNTHSLIYVFDDGRETYIMPDHLTFIQKQGIHINAKNIIINPDIKTLTHSSIYDCELLEHLWLPGVNNFEEFAIDSLVKNIHVKKDIKFTTNFCSGYNLQNIFFNGTKKELEAIYKGNINESVNIFYYKDFDELSEMGYDVGEINQIYKGYDKELNLSISEDLLDSNILRNFVNKIDSFDEKYYLWIEACFEHDHDKLNQFYSNLICKEIEESR